MGRAGRGGKSFSSAAPPVYLFSFSFSWLMSWELFFLLYPHKASHLLSRRALLPVILQNCLRHATTSAQKNYLCGLRISLGRIIISPPALFCFWNQNRSSLLFANSQENVKKCSLLFRKG